MVDSGDLRGISGASALFAALLAACCASAVAQPVSIEGLARSASLMKQIAETCGAGYDADVDLATRTERTFVQAGEKAFGKAVFSRTMAAEYQRRGQEVRSQGSDRWCYEQREALRELPGQKIFR